ncbi:hypothetical protein HGM15179_002126 [Zosterops borbonicus]|uniref:Uncharacterized protein n=1 Tax=Zosterops borbonicus TaxID=364589 RepID=A0A8K1LS85_9PASS|nr:hypothetical protein HGM15179_002126 [Zosterops borbonicus]
MVCDLRLQGLRALLLKRAKQDATSYTGITNNNRKKLNSTNDSTDSQLGNLKNAAVEVKTVIQLVECLKYDTDSDLDHLPAASTSLSKGIEMASKPQRIKL